MGCPGGAGPAHVYIQAHYYIASLIFIVYDYYEFIINEQCQRNEPGEYLPVAG